MLVDDSGNKSKDFKINLNDNRFDALFQPNNTFSIDPTDKHYNKEINERDKFQFTRIGYFCLDKDTTTDKLVFNKTVDLKVLVKDNKKKEEN